MAGMEYNFLNYTPKKLEVITTISNNIGGGYRED